MPRTWATLSWQAVPLPAVVPLTQVYWTRVVCEGEASAECALHATHGGQTTVWALGALGLP